MRWSREKKIAIDFGGEFIPWLFLGEILILGLEGKVRMYKNSILLILANVTISSLNTYSKEA